MILSAAAGWSAVPRHRPPDAPAYSPCTFSSLFLILSVYFIAILLVYITYKAIVVTIFESPCSK
jgi:hypothetical protein